MDLSDTLTSELGKDEARPPGWIDLARMRQIEAQRGLRKVRE